MYEQLRNEHRSLGNTQGEQATALNLAEIEHARGQTQRAIAIVRETLPAARSGADNIMLAKCSTTSRAISARWTIFPARLRRLARRSGSMPRASRTMPTLRLRSSTWRSSVALRGDFSRAATLEGYADAAFGRHGFERQFTETTTHDRLTPLLRESLAPDELARLKRRGRCAYTRGCDRARA